MPTPPRGVPVAVSASPAVTLVPKIYSTESNVVRPVTVLQDLPRFPRNIGPMRSGVLEIVIDEAGRVETATIRSSINARYDVIALQAATSWKYKPATFNGKPVKFRKTIVVRPTEN
jgi:TonB family protein